MAAVSCRWLSRVAQRSTTNRRCSETNSTSSVRFAVYRACVEMIGCSCAPVGGGDGRLRVRTWRRFFAYRDFPRWIDAPRRPGRANFDLLQFRGQFAARLVAAQHRGRARVRPDSTARRASSPARLMMVTKRRRRLGGAMAATSPSARPWRISRLAPAGHRADRRFAPRCDARRRGAGRRQALRERSACRARRRGPGTHGGMSAPGSAATPVFVSTHGQTAMRLAAIDIGTNSTTAIIARRAARRTDREQAAWPDGKADASARSSGCARRRRDIARDARAPRTAAISRDRRDRHRVISAHEERAWPLPPSTASRRRAVIDVGGGSAMPTPRSSPRASSGPRLSEVRADCCSNSATSGG